MRDIIKAQIQVLWACRLLPAVRQLIRAKIRDLRTLPGLQVRA